MDKQKKTSIRHSILQTKSSAVLMVKSSVRLLVLTLVCALLLTSCVSSKGESLLEDQPQSSPSENAPVRAYKIALVMKTLTNPFFVDMEKGARKAESELNIQLIVKTGAQETSIEQQIQIVEELITQKVDAIVIAPGSSVDLVKVLKKAQDAGIKIVNIDNRLDAAECKKEGLSNVPFISVKNDDAAYLSAKAIADLATEPTKAIIIEGIREAENAELRREGAVRAFDMSRNIQIVASESANWKIDEAHDLAKSLFVKYPEVKLVFCANDMMALGVIEYLKESGRTNVLVAGFDNLADMQSAIKDGWAYATVDQQADLQGYTGVVTAVNMLNGSVPKDVTYVDAKLITKDALDS